MESQIKHLMTGLVNGTLACVAVKGELEVLIVLEQMIQNPSRQWEVNACEITPHKVWRHPLALIVI